MWRLIGVAFYSSIIVIAAAIPVATLTLTPWRISIRSAASFLVSPWNWISVLSLCAIQVPVIIGRSWPCIIVDINLIRAQLRARHARAAQAPLLTAVEPQLVRLWRLRLPWWLAQPLSRLVGCCSSLNSLRSAALYLALSAVAGSISMQCIAWLRSYTGEHTVCMPVEAS